jgi:hypothetical protein
VDDSIARTQIVTRAYAHRGRAPIEAARVGAGLGILLGGYCIRHWKRILAAAALWSGYLYSWESMGLISWFVATFAVLVAGIVLLRRQN